MTMPLQDLTMFTTKHRSMPLPRHAYAYFDHVEAEYRTLPGPRANPMAEGEAKRVLEKKQREEELTWGDLYGLETAVLQLQPLDRLRSRAVSLRQKYREMAGPAAYAAYASSTPPDPATAAEPELRADMEQILSEFHWLYSLTPIREGMRSALSRRIGIVTFSFLLIVCVLVWIDYVSSTFLMPTLPIIIAAGMLGSFISVQRRIQGVPATGDPVVNIFELEHARLSVYLAPVAGAVFALILYLAFTGELLQGAIFPKMISPPGPFNSGMVLSVFTRG